MKKNIFWKSQLKKDFQWDFSYKISFFGQFIGIFFTVTIFFFISKIFENSNTDHLLEYDNNYFVFSIIGISILDLVVITMRSISLSVREAQSFGYIENIMTSRISPVYLLLCTCIYPFIKGVIRILFYIFLLVLFSEINISLIILFNFMFFLFITIIPFVAISLLAGAFVIYFKQADPINFLANTFISIFSGIIYPVTVLPSWMQNISDFIPLTYQLKNLRMIILEKDFNPYGDLINQFLYLCFSLVFLVFAIYITSSILKLVKKSGTLGSY